VRAESDWEVVAPVPFALVCFRFAPSGVHEEVLNDLNAKLLARVNATGEVFLSHTKLDGRYVLRLAVGNIRTEEKHVRRAWELLRELSVNSP
jgi:aromatic-L-amino-acid decarboxylase